MPTSEVSFTILDTVDSTNNYAMAKVRAGLAKHGDAWFSPIQTAGKGQRGNTWQSSESVSIALSVVVEIQILNAAQQFQLSVAVALGCYDFFNKYAGDETAIKWPNDIYWRDRKAGGVLIENIFHGKGWKFSVVGVGFNINQSSFEDNLKNPVSLKQITGKNFDVVALAKELHQILLKKYELIKNESFTLLYKEYSKHLFCLNKKVKLKKDNSVFETTIKGVTEHGQLITQDTTERFFNFGEVSWVL